jgi:hypothetical protein
VSILVDIQTFSIAIASVSVVAGVIYYALQMRHQTKVRQTDLIMRLRSAWRSRELRDSFVVVMNLESKDYSDYAKKYPLWEGVGAPEVRAVGETCTFFDDIGILLRRGLIDIGMVDDLFGFWIKVAWEKVKPLIEGRRKDLNQPTIYKFFEYVYDEMKKREQAGVKSG